MTFQTDPLQGLLVNPDGTPSTAFQVYWQKFRENLEEQEARQDETIARIRRVNSHTAPTTILTAEDDGATATITVAAHDRKYGDGTSLTVAGGSQSGLTSNTPYGVYYDDETLEDATPTYVFTTDIDTAQAAAAAGRHFCGVINTPPAGSGQTREGGGAYPMGSAIGGEV